MRRLSSPLLPTDVRPIALRVQALLLGALAWVLGSGIAAADDARQWLARADTALATRNYVGVFVHEHAGESETLRVVHRVAGDGVSERLLSMDGSGREFIRRGSELTAYLPDQRTVLVEKSPESSLMFGALPRVDASSVAQYQVQELPQARVSGRDTHVIAITPLDALRYGYRLWIDAATAMPLKTQLRDARGAVLEQIVFTDLRLPAHIPDSELAPAIDAHAFRWVQRDSADADAPAPQDASVAWQASALPPGFRMTTSTHQMLPGGPVEHLVFSDGLASVSVFIDLDRSVRSGEAREDAARLGSSSAYSTVVQGFRVTAVGEVPPDTVRSIALSMRASNADAMLPDATPGLGLTLSPVLGSSAAERRDGLLGGAPRTGYGGAFTAPASGVPASGAAGAAAIGAGGRGGFGGGPGRR